MPHCARDLQPLHTCAADAVSLGAGARVGAALLLALRGRVARAVLGRRDAGIVAESAQK